MLPWRFSPGESAKGRQSLGSEEDVHDGKGDADNECEESISQWYMLELRHVGILRERDTAEDG